jgi:phosphatidylglycerophosphate synthase
MAHYKEMDQLRQELETKKYLRLLPASWIDAALGLADRFSRSLVRLRVHPNALTVLGLLSGVAVGLFYGTGRDALAAAFIIICGIFDILDGKVAANGGRKSLFGAILDSSLDRYAEFFIYLGLAYRFRGGWGLWLMFFAFLGSTMVSYTRARAEGLGMDCRVGIMQRAERLLLLFAGTVVGLLFGVSDPALLAAMTVVTVVSNITAVQRIFHVRSYEKNGSPRRTEP